LKPWLLYSREQFAKAPLERLSLRIACRAAEWPADLETWLTELWGAANVAICELAPLRRRDVRAAAEAIGCPADDFLAEVDRLSAAQFANRPITLDFLLKSFQRSKKLPALRTELYRSGCLVLSDEIRSDLRRSRRGQRLSSGQRLAVARMLASIIVFCQRPLFGWGRSGIFPQKATFE
jgi:hypothetical protein